MVDRETMTLKCIRCGKSFRMLDMVVDASSHGMACRPCAGLAPKKVDTPFARQRIIPQDTGQRKSGPVATGRQRFACNDCKYRFGSNKPLAELSCPYCGSKRLATQAEMSADSLISASTERRFD